MRVGRFLIPAAGVALALALSSAEAAPPGTLDPSFGQHGEIITKMGDGGSGATAIALESDGKIVVAGGGSGFALARYTSRGSLDPTFGRNGKVTTAIGVSSGAAAVALQPDGKIVAFGDADPTRNKTDFALARYLPNGSLDSTFGSAGTVMTGFGPPGAVGLAVRIQPDGKILAAGLSAGSPDENVDLARYKPDGSLDPSFGDNGKESLLLPLAVSRSGFGFQQDGKILVAGTASKKAVGVVRLDPDGTLDHSFGTDGLATVSIGRVVDADSVAAQSDGKILVGGYTEDAPQQSAALARFNQDGSPDSNFGNHGAVLHGASNGGIFALTPAANGRIVAVGWGRSTDFAVFRYLADGSLDPRFGSRGVKYSFLTDRTDDAALAVSIQPNGRIVAAGKVDNAFGVARYLSSTRDRVCTVPQVKGKRLVAARRLIRHGHCRVGRVRSVFSNHVARGRVVAQGPHAGAFGAPGAPVKLKISKGPRPDRR